MKCRPFLRVALAFVCVWAFLFVCDPAHADTATQSYRSWVGPPNPENLLDYCKYEDPPSFTYPNQDVTGVGAAFEQHWIATSQPTPGGTGDCHSPSTHYPLQVLMSIHWSTAHAAWVSSMGGASDGTNIAIYYGASCPNGGTLDNSTYPGYCIVNGQPPPSNNCSQAKIDYPGAYTITVPAGQTPPSAGDIVSTGQLDGGEDSNCEMSIYALQMDKDGTVYAFGTLTGKSYGGTATPTGTYAKPSDSPSCAGNVCVNTKGTMAGANAPDPEQQATVDGQPITIPGSIPPNGCVSTASGGMFCAATAPPPVDSQGAVIPPDTTVTTTGTGGTVTNNYYSNTTVNGSANYGNGQGVTTTTTTTTNPDGSTTTDSKTTYPNPVFPDTDSVQTSQQKAIDAANSAPITQAASSVFNQPIDAGACPDTSFTLKSLGNKTFDFGVCSFWQQNAATIGAIFVALWVLVGALIVLST